MEYKTNAKIYPYGSGKITVTYLVFKKTRTVTTYISARGKWRHAKGPLPPPPPTTKCKNREKVLWGVPTPRRLGKNSLPPLRDAPEKNKYKHYLLLFFVVLIDCPSARWQVAWPFFLIYFFPIQQTAVECRSRIQKV